jgi:hypothetical protein
MFSYCRGELRPAAGDDALEGGEQGALSTAFGNSDFMVCSSMVRGCSHKWHQGPQVRARYKCN